MRVYASQECHPLGLPCVPPDSSLHCRSRLRTWRARTGPVQAGQVQCTWDVQRTGLRRRAWCWRLTPGAGWAGPGTWDVPRTGLRRRAWWWRLTPGAGWAGAMHVGRATHRSPPSGVVVATHRWRRLGRSRHVGRATHRSPPSGVVVATHRWRKLGRSRHVGRATHRSSPSGVLVESSTSDPTSVWQIPQMIKVEKRDLWLPPNARSADRQRGYGVA